MAITRNGNIGNTGYRSDEEGYLTNFIFDILAVEFKDNLYGSFDIKIRNGLTSTIIKDLNVLGPGSENLSDRIIEEGCFIVFKETTANQLVDIFSLEFDLFKARIINQPKIK